MNRLIVILAITVAAIFGSIYLLRTTAPSQGRWSSYSPLDPTVRVTPEDLTSTKAPIPDRAAKQSPAEDLAKAFQSPEEEAYKEITSLIEDWAPSDPRGAFNALLQMPEGELRHNALIQLARIWAETNPQLAAETFKAQTSGDEQERGVAQAIATWTKSDPMAALNWINQNIPANESSVLRGRFYAAWATVEPEAATRHALTQNANQNELDAALASWAHSDLAAAVEFQKTQIPPDKQISSRNSLLLAAAAQNSPLSESLLKDFLGANPTRDEALRIAKALSSLQPKLAQTIADSLPQGPDTEALRARIASFSNPKP